MMNSLKYALSRTSNPESRESLIEIIQSIKVDYKIDDIILDQLKYYLKNSQGVNPALVIRKAQLKLNLDLPPNYIKSPGGLGMVCNNILINLRNAYEDNKPFKRIPQYKIVKCKTVGSIIKIIHDGFEAL
ncbi:hypothetical protein [Polaribacter cellanae]|uniref:Uncharacterized protein n=1 Tax=Polaribacter cellanae TaxID=2818493 RepID=A0A975CMF2_9FLAO|nr:hypothetical protein [Polaribacter cellanae]QTE21230.1 hypothetical protein J3359_10300 [Polaribacter cellanae]